MSIQLGNRLDGVLGRVDVDLGGDGEVVEASFEWFRDGSDSTMEDESMVARTRWWCCWNVVRRWRDVDSSFSEGENRWGLVMHIR